MTTDGNNSKLSYIQCEKGGFHYGQVLNMVCMDAQCSDQLICCCACIEQSHKKHNTKPLKMIIKEAQEQVLKMKPNKFNIDVLIDIMVSNQKAIMENFFKLKKQLEQQLIKVEKLIINYYNSVISEIKLKNSDPNVEYQQAFQTIHLTKIAYQFKQAVKKLAIMIPCKDQQPMDLSQEELIESLENSNQSIESIVFSSVDEINKKVSSFYQILNKEMNLKNIWSRSIYKFSNTFKHPDVKLVSDQLVKSTNSSGYKFSIMEPSLEKGSKIKKFSFKIKQCTSNWVAVGMCHQKIVASKAYAFNFSSLGHGGYLISANGGSWSNTKTDANNAVKAFKFAKNDVIVCTANFETKKLTFKKKGTNETYELLFQKIPGDDLHPCALFYYINDQVEFLPKVKE